MAQQTINVGAAPNDGTGTPLRTAFQYTNSNFSELYTAVGPSGNNIVVPGNATITGDLTVDTSTLKVDSTNNRVTVGTTSAYGRLTVGVGSGLQAGTTTNVASGLYDIDYATTGDINTRFSFVNSNGVTNAAIDRIGNPNVTDSGNLAFLTRSGAGSLTERYRIASDGVATWSNVGGVAGTAMTLNSTGLGVGASPVEKLTVAGRGLFVSANPDNAALKLEASAGTNSVAINFVNTGGNYFVGVDNSVGGRLYGVPYSLCIGSTGAYPVVIATNNTARLTVDSSGNVGIGVTPSAWTIKAVQVVNGSIYGAGNETGFYGNAFYGSSGWTYIAAAGASGYLQNAGTHQWFTAAAGAANAAITDFATAKMTLDASGNLLVGKTSTAATAGGGVAYLGRLDASRDTGNAATFNHTTAGNLVGWIAITSTATTYNSASDYRLKESVSPLNGGLARVNALKPSIYKWKSNGSDGEGFLAHELAEVVPSAVTGEKDAVNEDGSIKAQGVDLSKVVPILVAAIKELTARVEALEA